MAGIELKLTFEDGALVNVIEGTRERLGDLSPALNAIGGYLENITLERFETGTGPDGVPWRPSRRAQLEGGKTLIDKGRLMDSIAYQVDGDEVSVGSNLVYAAIHQLGGTIQAKSAGKLMFGTAEGGFAMVDSVDIPARPFLGANDDDIDEAARILNDFIGEAGRR